MYITSLSEIMQVKGNQDLAKCLTKLPTKIFEKCKQSISYQTKII